MRVRMIQHLVGSGNELVPGREYDLDTAEANRLVSAGFAARVVDPNAPAIETAVAPPPLHETAVSRPKRRK